ncbi:hypothetical protein THAOC_15429 [Thalassiosira oceanica]|uniref:Leucine-rich repeat protein n=1 Tax=Thalassiosira oceanica TaxID=159749 RepID=K0T091_THAOC|nr:hypothetical protein THAOC_15429 [Thalassiosira oceanica]|eukprot:EJK63892.1 hypothetical protein THAOC_15429 [Thalassiosira oceanica]
MIARGMFRPRLPPWEWRGTASSSSLPPAPQLSSKLQSSHGLASPATPVGSPLGKGYAPQDEKWCSSALGSQAHPSQDPGVPPPLAGLALARALAQNPTKADRTQTRRRGRALQTEDFQQAGTANPVPPSSRTPVGSVKNEWIWAEESNSRRGKPRSKRRFYLAFTLTKLSKDRASSLRLGSPSSAGAGAHAEASRKLSEEGQGQRSGKRRKAGKIMDSREGSKRQRGSHLTDNVFPYEGGEIAREFRSEITRARIGPHIKNIPYGTFRGCINLVEVQFEEGGALQMIGYCAFFKCDALQQATIPSSVSKLGDFAFGGCSNLAEVRFEEGLEIIGEGSFYECTALRSVTVPSSVTELGAHAFHHCSNLTEVIFLGGERLLNQGFLDRGLFSGKGVLNWIGLNEMICSRLTFARCPLTALKIFVSGTLFGRMVRLPKECRLSVEGRIRSMRRLELTQDGYILACFPFVVVNFQDADNQTAESLHQVLRLISFHELKESSILVELALWKSRLVVGRARADCRTSVPDPAKRLIMEYCGFTGFLEPAIEG